MFHAFTDCGTEFSFATRGKETAIKAPKSIPKEVISIVKRFTILLYNLTRSQLDIDQAHLKLFTKKYGGMEEIFQTKNALVIKIELVDFRSENVGRGRVCEGSQSVS